MITAPLQNESLTYDITEAFELAMADASDRAYSYGEYLELMHCAIEDIQSSFETVDNVDQVCSILEALDEEHLA